MKINKMTAFAATVIGCLLSYEAAAVEKIFLNSQRDRTPGTREQHIWMVNPDGSDLEQLTFGNTIELVPALSPDGTKLVFIKAGDFNCENVNAVWVMDLPTGRLAQLTDGSMHDNHPVFSADGNQIAFDRHTHLTPANCNAVVGGSGRIWVASVDFSAWPPTVTQLRQVSDTVADQGNSRLYPSWNPSDPNLIAYMHEGWQIYTVKHPDAVGAPMETQLFSVGGQATQPAYSPVNSNLLTYNISNQANIRDISGGVSHVISSALASPKWSPDGRYLVGSLPGQVGIRKIDVSNPAAPGSPEVVTNGPDASSWWGNAVLHVADHFLLYDVKITKNTPKFEKRTVALADQFDAGGPARDFEVDKAERLGNPADKAGEGIGDPDTHLVVYKIKKSPGVAKHVRLTGVKVSNQFGEIVLDTQNPDQLLVPSLKDLGAPIPGGDLPDPFPLDHFKCYKVKIKPGTAKFEKRDVQVVDQFNQPALLEVDKPERLCNPVDKNGEGIANPDGHLLCYKVKRVKPGPKFNDVKGIHINNQFGALQLDAKKEAELCLPSIKDISAAVPIGG